jgi:CHAT domain-containing protein/tetratricopeptide (TPR) repeat protein
LNGEAQQLLRQGLYAAAGEKFQAAWRESIRAGDEENAIVFLNNLGACHAAAFRYRESMAAYTAAQALARKNQDWEMAGVLEGNLAALYAQMGEVDSALRAAESGLALLRRAPASAYRPQLLCVLARLQALSGQLDSALRLYSEAIQEADRRGDSSTQAQAWNRVGHDLLRAGQIEGAEQALLEAFRLRKLSGDQTILLSYRALGLLSMAQGNLSAAAGLLDQAVALARKSPRLVPLWQLHHDRGRVKAAQGRLVEALEDFRRAVESARRWRPQVLPADPLRVSAETGLQEVYSSLVEAGNRLYLLRGDPALARETFEVAEENRAYSLRMLVAEPQEWREKLPPEYGEHVARLRAAEVTLLASGSRAAHDQIRELHRLLTEMELRIGMDSLETASGAGPAAGLAERVQGSLGRNEALLSFHLGEPESYLWAITREGLELKKLPPRSHVRARVERFTAALGQGAADAPGLAETLYRELLGGLRESTRGKRDWLLTLEDVLFELPFAALAESSGAGGPKYLIEGHSLEVVPGAHLLVSARAKRPPPRRRGVFMGVGDPVYNTADPRWSAGADVLGARQRLELPRLPGSAREIRACARLWSEAGSAPTLLEGRSATLAQVGKKLESRPAVVHFATHVVPSSRKRGMIALSLAPTGQAEMLSPLEVVHQRRSPSLVVLSGCSSAQGEALPGAGLMGLTRAWLAAGADTVVASRWPTADDTGEMFLSFYRRLLDPRAGHVRPATALQGAQTEMLHSGNWRSAPRYWAAFFAVGWE